MKSILKCFDGHFHWTLDRWSQFALFQASIHEGVFFVAVKYSTVHAKTAGATLAGATKMFVALSEFVQMDKWKA